MTNLDPDTVTKGTSPPFEHWESDHTALVHVLWHIEKDETPDEVASRIMRSRWMAAVRYQAAEEAMHRRLAERRWLGL